MAKNIRKTDLEEDEWSGLISNVRISPSADPELYRELGRSSHRERSRRLRALALLGLYAASRCGSDRQPGGEVREQSRVAADQQQIHRGADRGMADLTNKMLGSIQ